VRRRAGSWFFLSLGSLLLISLACATDESAEFEPTEAPLILDTDVASESDGSPALSEDARVLAWVRTSQPSGRRVVMRWDRVAGLRETLLEQSRPIAALDLSPEGERIVALVGADSLWIWRDGEPDQASTATPPAGYANIASPRWIDEDRILVGAVGPEGYGLWTWGLEAQELDPVCTRIPGNTGEFWLGTSGGFDRSGTYFCMERLAETRVSGIIGRRTDCSVLRVLDGTFPSFWTIDDTEEDGLLYLDRSHNLVGERPGTGERFVLVGSAFGFDVTADGRWVFAQVSRPAGRRLLLLHVREPR
jgi:hypothetical protein